MRDAPGIRIVYTIQTDRSPLVSRAEIGRPAPSSVHIDPRISIGVERPDGYPFESVESPRSLVCLEGHVYGGQRASLLSRLENLRARDLDDGQLAVALRSCTRAVDGDFVIVWYDRTNERLAIAGDRFGRLPLYYHLSDARVIVSRHQGSVLAHMEAPTIDRMALAHVLLLGYPLGARTLVEHVSRLLPDEILVASPRGAQCFAAPQSPFRRPAHVETPRTMAEGADRLRDAFVAACRDRAIDVGSHVLSLSGGIDSRTTGAGMRAALASFSAVTFNAPGSLHADERATASAVARVLGAHWRAYELDHADPRCIEEIIDLKLGLNPVDVAFGLEYVARVRADFAGPVAFWTGEGADKMLCEHRAIPRRPSPDELVRFIVSKNAVWDPASVSRLTHVHEDDLLGSIRAVVTGSGDIEPDDAYVHFLLSQRVVRFHVEGEDRHRTAVWPMAPFFGVEFVALARSLPAEWKHGRRLYRAFLTMLAPDVAALPLTGGHAAPASRRFAIEYATRERLRNNPHAAALYRRLWNARGARQTHDGTWSGALQRFLEAGAAPDPFVASGIDAIASGRVAATPAALSILLTTLLAARHIRTGTGHVH